MAHVAARSSENQRSMALLEAVVFPQPKDHRGLRPCCGSCGYGGGGEVEGMVIKRGVVVQGDVAPHGGGGGCCAWADVSGAGWVVSPVPSTLATTPPSSARRPVHHQAAPSGRRRGGATTTVAARAATARSTVAQAAESRRLNHIAVERGRRRQVNQHLAALRALMPPSYARRGDKAAIVGGAITFVKELEHRLQALQARRTRHDATAAAVSGRERFPGFFTSPQYSCGSASSSSALPAGVTDVEAAVSEGHATVKVLAERRPPGQQQRRRHSLLLRLLLGLQRRGLAALHLNVAAAADRRMALYTISLRMGDGCQLSSAGEIAAAVHDIVAGVSVAGEHDSI